MASVQVYTWSNCPYCVRAKDLLKRKNVTFEEIDLDGKDAELQALRARTGQRTVPQIFIDDKLIGGFSELAALDANGELDRLLKG
ncbi:MAG TPA: glutaredoxin 3 [Bdellovibrionales bacterium]|nr:glutaredoxin 3 [Bdellovibrionales bacterium]